MRSIILIEGGMEMSYTYKLDEKGIPYRAAVAAGRENEGDSDLLPHSGELENFHLYLF